MQEADHNAWSQRMEPHMTRHLKPTRKIRCRYTKRFFSLQEMSYLQRLQKQHALTFSDEREKTDLVLLFKCMHGIGRARHIYFNE